MANKDKRVKGCPNESCEFHKNQVKQKSDLYFCPKCGSPLIFVCKECFSEIEDISPKHKICALCEAKHEQQMNSVKKNAKKIGGAAVAGAAALVTPVLNKANNQLANALAQKGAKVVADIGKRVLKK